MYTVKDLLDMSPTELAKELLEARKTYAGMAIAVKLGKEKNTAELRKNRKYIAQIQTVIQKVTLNSEPPKVKDASKKSTKQDNK